MMMMLLITMSMVLVALWYSGSCSQSPALVHPIAGETTTCSMGTRPCTSASGRRSSGQCGGIPASQLTNRKISYLTLVVVASLLWWWLNSNASVCTNNSCNNTYNIIVVNGASSSASYNYCDAYGMYACPSNTFCCTDGYNLYCCV